MTKGTNCTIIHCHEEGNPMKIEMLSFFEKNEKMLDKLFREHRYQFDIVPNNGIEFSHKDTGEKAKVEIIKRNLFIEFANENIIVKIDRKGLEPDIYLSYLEFSKDVKKFSLAQERTRFGTVFDIQDFQKQKTYELWSDGTIFIGDVLENKSLEYFQNENSKTLEEYRKMKQLLDNLVSSYYGEMMYVNEILPAIKTSSDSISENSVNFQKFKV